MKKISSILIMVGSLLGTSCQKSFLTLAPQSQATDVNFFKTASDINNAVSGCYSALQSSNMYQDHFITLMELRSDNIEDQNPGGNGGRDYTIDRFLAKSDNVAISESYAAIYNAISRSNNGLVHLDVVSNTSLKAQYEGEFRFLRALNYFNAVRLWGALPLVLTPIIGADAKALPRTSVDGIYAAIENDLTTASGLLPSAYTSNIDKGRATAGAAKALLGKVFLTEKKYPQAIATLKDLVPPNTNPYKYTLLPNISDVFSVTNKLNAEIIFAVHYEKSIAGQGHGLAQYFNQPALDPKLLSSYGPTDTRRDLLNTITLDPNNKPVKKYADTFDPTTNTLGNDYIILRYADVLLMYAEALNEVQYSNSVTADAFVYLNAVRSRANAVPYLLLDLPDQASFRNAVLKERRLELPFELQRWFDLIRTNTAISALTNSGLTVNTIQSYQFLYPIPQTEINIVGNPVGFPQNTGY